MRGRPTAAKAHGNEELSDFIKQTSRDKTTRTQAAHFYCSAAYSLLEKSEAASDIPYLEGIFKLVYDDGIPGVKEKSEIVEQLGRMLEQDGYSEEDVKQIATIAAKAYHDGHTVKEIKAYILHGRMTGDW